MTELHQECAQLQKEMEVARDKLGSSMNSIKTFWSPELKKERAMRKEEAAKCNMLNEQLKVTQAELKVGLYRQLFVPVFYDNLTTLPVSHPADIVHVL